MASQHPALFGEPDWADTRDCFRHLHTSDTMKLFLRFAACALTIMIVSSAAALAWDRADRAAGTQSSSGH